MKKLSKTLKIAKLEGKNPDMALNEFLAAYHDTPHSATGIAPNILMFGHARSSGLPTIVRDDPLKFQAECHLKAQEQHKLNAENMKRQYDERMKAKECQFHPGDEVLFKRDITKKDVSH